MADEPIPLKRVPPLVNDRGGGSYGMTPEMSGGMTFREIGSLGLRAWSGWVREEFLPELIGRQGATKYREMADNSPIIGAILYAIKSTLRKVEWRVVPAGAEENDATDPKCQQMADFVESNMHDMTHTWEDLIDENLSMLQYGYAPFELCYKKRMGRDPGADPQNPGEELPQSEYDDGLIGWRRIPIRGQDTVLKWFFDKNGQIKGMTQLPWVGPMIDIPIEKMLIFRPSAHKNNPEGRSILRTSYLPYYFVKRFQEQEAIVGERLGGVPVLNVPGDIFENADKDPKAAAALQNYKKIATNVRIDEQMGIVLPSDVWQGANGTASASKMFDFQLITPTGRPMGGFDFDKTITRYNTYIMTSVLADFLTLGHEARGTQSLATTKVDMFFQAIEGFLNSMAAIYNRHALPRLWRLNGFDYDCMPKITPDLAQRIDLDVLSNFVLRMSQSGMPLFPDEDLQSYIRDAAGLPDITDEHALQASGLTDEQLATQDEKDAAMLENIKNPPVPGKGGPMAPGKSNFDKMALASVARRAIRLGGPKFGVHTHKRRGGEVARPFVSGHGSKVDKFNPNHVPSGPDGGQFATSGSAPAKDKPVTLVFGGSFNPPHLGHAQAVKDATDYVRSQGYDVHRAVVVPTPDSLLGRKLGAKAYPLQDRVNMTRIAMSRLPNTEVTGDPSAAADKFQGKIARTQLADWARANYPGSTVMAVTGPDSAPGANPPKGPAIYSGDPGTKHEGYNYVVAPREGGEKSISSTKVRGAIRAGDPVPAGMIDPAVEGYLYGMLSVNPNIEKAGYDPNQERDDDGKWTSGGGTHLEKVPAIKEAIDRGAFEFSERSSTPYRTAYNVRPNDIPADWKAHTQPTGSKVYYDPKAAHVVDGYVQPIGGRHSDIPEKQEAGTLYRGMSYEEYQQAKQRGYFETSGQYNIGDEQKGLTFFSSDPSQAASYAHGFAPWQYMGTPGRPPIVVSISDAGEKEVNPRFPTEIGLRGRVPTSSIKDVYIGRAYDVRPGSIDVVNDGRGVVREGSRFSPSVGITWEKQGVSKVGPPDEDRDQWGRWTGGGAAKPDLDKINSKLGAKLASDLLHYFDLSTELRHGRASLYERKMFTAKEFMQRHPKFKNRLEFIFNLLPDYQLVAGAHAFHKFNIHHVEHGPDGGQFTSAVAGEASPYPETEKLKTHEAILDMTGNPREAVAGFLTPKGEYLDITGYGGTHARLAAEVGTNLTRVMNEGTARIYSSADFLGIEINERPTDAQVKTLNSLARANHFEQFIIENNYPPGGPVTGRVTPTTIRMEIERAFSTTQKSSGPSLEELFMEALAKYSDDQPRDPKGSATGGQWTGTGYHGTASKFGELESRAPEGRGAGQPKAIYFSSDPNTAYSYGAMARRQGRGEGPVRVITANLRMENPLDITDAIKAGKKSGLSFPEAKRKALQGLTSENDGFIFRGDKLNPAEYAIFSQDQATITKYSPDQPRNPKGSGRISGEWTGGGADETGPTPNGAFHISDQDKAEIRGMISRDASPSEIDSHPAIRAAQEYQRTLGETDKMPGYGTARWRAEREFAGGIRGYNSATDNLMVTAAKFSNGPIQQGREATILLGPPASGKSAFAEQIAAKRSAALVDPDDAKKLFNEYRGGIGANAIHEESARLSSGVLNRFVAAGSNLVLPKVGAGAKSIQDLTDALRSAGYKVNLVNMDVDENKAYVRATGRFLATGRLVSKSYTVDVDAKPSQTFKTQAATGQYNDVVNIDNNYPVGRYVITQGKDTDIGRAIA